MFALLHSLTMFVIDFFKSPRRLEAGNLFLRHQLSIALRRAPPRLRLHGTDRAMLGWMAWLWPRLLRAAPVVQPENIPRCDPDRMPLALQESSCRYHQQKQLGLDHLGIQVESRDELQEVYARLRSAGDNIIEQGQTSCCYAKSEKSWTDDPAGIAWETFFTTGESTEYGDGSGERE